MKPLRLNNPRKKRSKAFLILGAFLCFFILFKSFSGTINNSFYGFSSPAQKTLGSLGNESSFVFKYLFNLNQIKDENNKLKQERQELISQVLDLKEKERENEELKRILNLGLEKEFNLVLAGAFSFDIASDSFLIDKGSDDGISVGMPVITSKKIIVGKVFEVYDNFSRIMLVTHKDSPFFDALIQGSETMGIVKGEGNFKMILDLIDKKDEIEQEEAVVTLGEVFPKGMFVGLVKEVINLDTEPFQKAEIQLIFNPRKIDRVFIITDY
jgi:rod shape-determining protein MreC